MCLSCNQMFASNMTNCPQDGSILIALEEDPFLGKVVNERYQIKKQIGKGGMGTVYLAEQTVLGRLVAVKMLHAQLSEDKVSVKRFEQEASASSGLQHQNLITLYDYGMIDGRQPYLVMEYLQGESLADIIKREGAVNPVRCARIFAQVMDGLQYAHNKGVVHRDIKPSNIILINNDSMQDLVKVVDFGLAKLMPWSGKESQHLTKTGEVFGSPIYMSPEQCRGDKLEPSSDIYSVGITLFETLAGKPPFKGANVVQTASKHLYDTPPSFSQFCPELNLSPRLDAAVLKSLEKEVAHRFLNMNEFKEALNHAVSGPDGGLGGAEANLPDSTQAVRREDLKPSASQTKIQRENSKSASTVRKAEIRRDAQNKTGLILGSVAALILAGAGAWFFLSGAGAGQQITTTGIVYYLDLIPYVKDEKVAGMRAAELHLHTDQGLLRLKSDRPLSSSLKTSLELGKIWKVTYAKDNLLEESAAGTDSVASEANQVIRNHFFNLASGDLLSAWQDFAEHYKKTTFKQSNDEKAFKKFRADFQVSDLVNSKENDSNDKTKRLIEYNRVVVDKSSEKEIPSKSVKIESTTIDHAIALIDTTYFYKKPSGFHRYTLIKENGNWKIDRIDTGLTQADWDKF